MLSCFGLFLQLKCHLSEGDMLMQTAKPESECVVASLGAIVCHLKASLIDQFVQVPLFLPDFVSLNVAILIDFWTRSANDVFE